MRSHLAEEVFTSILVDPRKLAALRLVRELELPEGAIAGDLVRCAVFDRLHAHEEPTQLRGIDVVYFDPERPEASVDENLVGELRALAPRRPWRVTNLARERPDAGGLEAALDVFPATASAVAVRADGRDELELLAPFGLSDLVSGVVRPVAPERAGELRRLVTNEKWAKRYPRLTLKIDPA